MAMTVQDFWATIQRLGILDESGVRLWSEHCQRLLAEASGSAELPQGDALQLAKLLIQQKVLTQFQAKRMLAGRGGELLQGDYLVAKRVGQAPLSRWYAARHLPTGLASLVFPCTSAVEARHQVDPAWLAPHVAVSADGLQPLSVEAFTPHDASPWRGLVVSALPDGHPLDQWLADQAMHAVPTAIDLGLVLGGALAALHRASLFHGGLRPGRVWIGDDGSVFLLRCGGGPPIFPGDSVAPPHDWFDDDGRAADFAAPQWLAGQTQADACSDVYSLGALIYFVATGRTPPRAALPEDVAGAVAAGAGGDPLLRVLGAAMAVDPQQRFPDVLSFMQALQAVQPLVGTAAEGVNEGTAEGQRPSPAATAKGASERPPAAQRTASVPTTKPPPERPPSPTRDASARSKSDQPGVPAGAAQSRRPKRRRKRRSNKGPVIIGSSAAAVLLLLLAVLFRTTVDRAPPPRARPKLPSPTVAEAQRGDPSAQPARDQPDLVDGFQLVDDDELLWVPPWAADSQPPPLDLVVPGAQVVVSLRPASLLDQQAGADWLAWFGDELGPTLESLEQRCGVSPARIDRLTLGLTPGQAGDALTTLAVRLIEPVELATLADRWDASASQTPQGQTMFAADGAGGDAYYVPGESLDDQSPIESFAVGPLETIKLVAEGEGAPIPMAPSMAAAWRRTSAQADVVVMAVPNFLFADGRNLLRRYVPRAVEPLRQMLIPDVSVAVATFDMRSQWYGELSLVPGGGSSPAGLLRELRQRIERLRQSSEAFLADAGIPPSWRVMAFRLPNFLSALADQTRFGISDQLPVVNFYLPAAAAPQLSLATLLALSSGEGAAVTTTAAAQESPKTMSISEMLNTPMSISFDQESLEFAIGMIGEEFARSLPAGALPPKITIIGGDLEKSGITQNQQVRDFQMRDQPLREVLTELVAGANPDKTATSTADDKQTLIWVVAPASTPEAPELLVTTRPAAASDGYELPEEFVSR